MIESETTEKREWTGILRGLRKSLTAACCALALIQVSAAQVFGGVRDFNAELETAYRSDLVGPEMWTVTARFDGRFKGDAASYRSTELPSRVYAEPKPGLNGHLHLVHGTELYDAVGLSVSDGGAPLTFAAVRNRWTPAWTETYYRSVSLDRCDDSPQLGATVLKERKCIDGDNTFVAEAVLKNTSASSRVYTVTVILKPSVPRAPGAFGFTTTARGVKAPRVSYAAVGASDGRLMRTLTLAPNGTATFRYAFAVGGESVATVTAARDRALAAADPFKENAARFNAWMAKNAPALEIADADIRKLYVYRWFLVWRGIHEARRVIPDHEYPLTSVYESPMGRWYGCVIGLPVPMQVQELAWMRDPSVGRAHLRNWCAKVIGYRGYIQFTGMAAWRFYQNHPDAAFAREIYGELLADAKARQGDDPSKLPVQRGSWGTGAEYQPNFYQFTEPKWDYHHDHEYAHKDKGGYTIARLVRLDTAGYVLGDLVGAGRLAAAAGDAAAAEDALARVDAGVKTIATRHWDEKLELFLAADPETYRLADEAVCYDSFAPYMWGLVKNPAYLKAFDKFCDPAWFWDDYPISTVAKTCPMYCGGNFIRGPFGATPAKVKRYGCCWNGPMWHYADSLAAEAFGQAARLDPTRREMWLEYFRRWTESHFLYGDRTAPRAAEHFRPEDGARTGGAYDYFHSSWIDPFIRYWCGVSLSDDLKTLSFEPFSRDDFILRGAVVGGVTYDFVQQNGVLTVADAAGRMLATGRGRVTLSVTPQTEKVTDRTERPAHTIPAPCNPASDKVS